MPLRDHFHPPLSNRRSWEGLHGQWPAAIVTHLRTRLPPGYVAEPRVHPGTQVEIDIATFEEDVPSSPSATGNGNGGVATAVWAPPRPSITVESDLSNDDEYEVLIYDATRGRTLVAAIELISPRNKDRPASRNVFVAKCAALWRKGVAVSIVDLVTTRHFNLYLDLLALIGHSDSTIGAEPPPLYAASCRWRRRDEQTILESWSHALTIGQPLPTLPLWLSEELAIPLDLEASYEQACHDLWIN